MSDKHGAIFLDRDGTLIQDVGVLSDPRNIRYFPDTFEALRRAGDNYQLFVVTNQPAVAKGELSLAQVAAVNRELDARLAEEGIQIKEWYVCPHRREEGCACIKPKPAFMLEAAAKYGLDLKRSFMIGDHPHDAMTGAETGVFGLYLLTGHGGKHLSELPTGKPVFHTLSDAVAWLLEHPAPQKALEQQIDLGARALQEGKTVVFPTETVYGLGADAFNADAVTKIFAIKQRPKNNPLIVHIAGLDQLDGIVSAVPEKALKLMKAFWPGPLTIVLPKNPAIPDIVTANNPTVAVRMPNHPAALELIRRAGTGVAAPSANSFGCTSPTSLAHVLEQLQCDAAIDGGACRIGVESTVITLVDEVPVLLRPGGISRGEIEAVIGPIRVRGEKAEGKLESPGLLAHHYAPRTALVVLDEIPEAYRTASDIGFMLLRPESGTFAGPVEILSEQGNQDEAATNLYAALRRLDSLGLRLLVTQPFPDTGIGQAINDRLKKASAGRPR